MPAVTHPSRWAAPRPGGPLAAWPRVLTWTTALVWTVLTPGGAARADVWAYVDERGVPHFASAPLDERYGLFFKQRDAQPAPAAADPLAVAVPQSQARLLAFLQASPHFQRVQHLLRDAARANGLEVQLLQALVAAESGFDAAAVSPKGAVGLMQLLPATAERWGVRGDERLTVAQKLLDPRTNLHAGSRYLRHLLSRYPGRLDLALAAYNAGEGAVARTGNRSVPAIRETQDYVKTVEQMLALLKPSALKIPAQALVNAAFPAIKSDANVPNVPAGGARGRGNLPPGLAGALPP